MDGAGANGGSTQSRDFEAGFLWLGLGLTVYGFGDGDGNEML